jgi:hypothetical protein
VVAQEEQASTLEGPVCNPLVDTSSSCRQPSTQACAELNKSLGCTTLILTQPLIQLHLDPR